MNTISSTNKSVLIIDDSQEDTYVLKRKLKQYDEHINITSKADGTYALKYFELCIENEYRQMGEVNIPDIIFLDINMPKMSGFEFLDYYHSLVKTFNLKESTIIMYSVSTNRLDQKQSKKYNYVKDYIPKAINSEQIEKIFKKLND